MLLDEVTFLFFSQAFKVDMLVETVWPDVAMKCGMMMYETDEVKKESMKEKLAEVRSLFHL